MQTITFDVHGMSCGGCTSSVQRALINLEGVSHAEVTLPGTAIVQSDPARINAGVIESAIIKLGYAAKVRSAGTSQEAVS